MNIQPVCLRKQNLSSAFKQRPSFHLSTYYTAKSAPWTKIFPSFPQGKILHAHSSAAAGDILKSNLQEMDVNRKLAQPYDWVSLTSSTIFRKANSPEELYTLSSVEFSQESQSYVFVMAEGVLIYYGIINSPYLFCWTIFKKMPKVMTAPHMSRNMCR